MSMPGLSLLIEAAMSKLAMMVATKLSNRSEQLPAMSLTLSPMKSAIVLGIRESSSSQAWRIFELMSEPMSAPLVKLPPATRLNIATREHPKEYAVRRKIVGLQVSKGTIPVLSAVLSIPPVAR